MLVRQRGVHLLVKKWRLLLCCFFLLDVVAWNQTSFGTLGATIEARNAARIEALRLLRRVVAGHRAVHVAGAVASRLGSLDPGAIRTPEGFLNLDATTPRHASRDFGSAWSRTIGRWLGCRQRSLHRRQREQHEKNDDERRRCEANLQRVQTNHSSHTNRIHLIRPNERSDRHN